MSDKAFDIYNTSIVHFIFIRHLDQFFLPKWRGSVAAIRWSRTPGCLLIQYWRTFDERYMLFFKKKRKCIVEFTYADRDNLCIDYYELTRNNNNNTNITLNSKYQKIIDIGNDVPLNIRRFTFPFLLSIKGQKVLNKLSTLTVDKE